MLRFILSISCLFVCMGGLFAEENSVTAKAAESQQPASWLEYRNFLQQHGFLGTWEANGTTMEIFEGIPAGIPYTQLTKNQLSQQGTEMQVSHRMETEDGVVISEGGGSVSWNDESDQIEGLVSGFDLGKPYSGKMVLISIDPQAGTERWSYQETSRGKVLNYDVENTQIDANHRKGRITVKATGTSIPTELQRKNPVGEFIAEFNTIGVWEAGLADGTRRRLHTEWILGGRVLQSKNVVIDQEGKETQKNSIMIYWDASRSRVVYVGADETGSSWRGERVSIKVEDGKTIAKTRFQGVTAEGVSTGITMTMTLAGDQLTRVFSEWTFDDGRKVLEQWYEPVVFHRMK
ncbi:MAG: hypothetical protein P8L85_08550 [Rubripirellula sp.]|nr:hypothetical protein [Rubripirellula sp.]